MQSFYRSLIQTTRPRFAATSCITIADRSKAPSTITNSSSMNNPLRTIHRFLPSSLQRRFDSRAETLRVFNADVGCSPPNLFASRSMTTVGGVVVGKTDVGEMHDVVAPRIKFKRLDKTAKHIMQLLDKEAVQEVRGKREIPDVQPGCIVQLKVEVPENKRRVSVLKGIVIARRNAGLNTTFRLRRQVAGVGVESLFPLYSPNIKEIKILERKKVRRAKLYYLRDKMNALRK